MTRDDRRRVVIQLVLERAMRDVAALFLPMMRDWQRDGRRYSDDELRLIVDFYDRMEQVLRRPPGPAPRGRQRPWHQLTRLARQQRHRNNIRHTRHSQTHAAAAGRAPR